MADEDRVVYPDEVEEIKETSEPVEEGEEAEIKKEEASEENAVPVEEASSIQPRNMITAPGNCPPGFQRGADGICRQVF